MPRLIDMILATIVSIFQSISQSFSIFKVAKIVMTTARSSEEG